MLSKHLPGHDITEEEEIIGYFKAYNWKHAKDEAVHSLNVMPELKHLRISSVKSIESGPERINLSSKI